MLFINTFLNIKHTVITTQPKVNVIQGTDMQQLHRVEFNDSLSISSAVHKAVAVSLPSASAGAGSWEILCQTVRKEPSRSELTRVRPSFSSVQDMT